MTTREQERALDLLCGRGYRVARLQAESMLPIHGERL